MTDKQIDRVKYKERYAWGSYLERQKENVGGNERDGGEGSMKHREI